MAKAIPLDRRLFIGLALMTGVPLATANPYGPTPWGYPPAQWSYPSQAPQTPAKTQPSQAPGQQAPAYNGWPASQPSGYGSQNYYANTQPPRIESELSLKTPYVQQGVMLKLSLVSVITSYSIHYTKLYESAVPR